MISGGSFFARRAKAASTSHFLWRSPAALPEGRKGFALPGASHFFRGEKVTKTPLRGCGP